MATFTLTPEQEWPAVTLDSLRKPYPFPRNRKMELASLQRALTRLVQGERDGRPMASSEAVDFLRSRIEFAAQDLAGREKSFTPHLTTWLNQSRYLRSGVVAEPETETVSEALEIVRAYPWRTVMPRSREHLAPLLRAVEQSIQALRSTHGAHAPRWILERTRRFAELIARWPEEDRQYVPGPLRFFQEQRWNQDERAWHRTPQNGYQSERQQIARVM